MNTNIELFIPLLGKEHSKITLRDEPHLLLPFHIICVCVPVLVQVALRIRPLSDGEQEEAATIVAHRLDEQVRAADL